MTPNQELEFAAFKAKHADDARVAAEFDEPQQRITRIEPYPCKVAGMLCVVDQEGLTMTLLYPTPRPVPLDPLFQHADGLDTWPRIAASKFVYGQRAFTRDWQWPSVLMDAPNTMPAGACRSFDLGDDAYGAEQMTWERDA